VLCLVALFVAVLLGATGAQAAPEGRDAGSATVEQVTVEGVDYLRINAAGTYIWNHNSGKCMGIAGGSRDNGVFSVQWTCHEIPGSDQDMIITPIDSAGIWHRIVPKHSSKCMGISAARPDPGTSLLQWTCLTGHNEQLFAFVGTSWDNVEIVVRHTGQCIGVSNGHTGDGGRVIQWGCTGGADQRWWVYTV
jgi:hypothetical protein